MPFMVEAKCTGMGTPPRAMSFKFRDIPGIRAVLGHEDRFVGEAGGPRNPSENCSAACGKALPHQLRTIITTAALNPKGKTKRKRRVADRFSRAGILWTGEEGGE